MHIYLCVYVCMRCNLYMWLTIKSSMLPRVTRSALRARIFVYTYNSWHVYLLFNINICFIILFFIADDWVHWLCHMHVRESKSKIISLFYMSNIWLFESSIYFVHFIFICKHYKIGYLSAVGQESKRGLWSDCTINGY